MVMHTKGVSVGDSSSSAIVKRLGLWIAFILSRVVWRTDAR